MSVWQATSWHEFNRETSEIPEYAYHFVDYADCIFGEDGCQFSVYFGARDLVCEQFVCMMY